MDRLDENSLGRRLLRLGALAAALLSLACRPDPRAACRGAESQLGGVWDAPSKRAIESAFAAKGGAAAWQTTAAQLDELARAWLAMYDDACMATRVASAKDYDLRKSCLLLRLQDLRSLSHRLLSVDPSRAAALVGALPDLGTCADLPTLRGRRAPSRHDETIKMGRLAAGFTHIVPFAGGILAYDASSGRAASLSVAADGTVSAAAQASWPAGFSSLAAHGAGVLAYAAMTGRMGTSDGLTFTEHDPWTPGLRVFGEPLLSYEPTSGEVRWIDEALHLAASVHIAPGYTHLVPYRQGEAPHLGAYNAKSGRLTLFRIDGEELPVSFDGGWGPGETHWLILDTGTPDAVGYRADNGHLGMDRLDRESKERIASDQPPGYTEIAGFQLKGRPHLLLYRRRTGEYLTLRLEPQD